MSEFNFIAINIANSIREIIVKKQCEIEKYFPENEDYDLITYASDDLSHDLTINKNEFGRLIALNLSAILVEVSSFNSYTFMYNNIEIHVDYWSDSSDGINWITTFGINVLY